VLTALVAVHGIQAARHPHQLTRRRHARKLAARNTRRDEIPRPHRAGPAQKNLDMAFSRSHAGVVP